MSDKPRLQYDRPEQRVADFERFFESSLEELDQEFVQFILGKN